MASTEMIEKAINIFNLEIKDAQVKFTEFSQSIIFTSEHGKPERYGLIISDLYDTVDFYLSQLLNPINLKLEELYPHLLKYVKLYYIERSYEESLPVFSQPYFKFHPTGVVEYIPSISTTNFISRVSIDKVSEVEAYCLVNTVSQTSGVVEKSHSKIRIGIHSNQGLYDILEPEWMKIIRTAADFYPGPSNISIYDMLVDISPKYKGNKLWVLGNDVTYIFVDNCWIPLFIGSPIPKEYEYEWNMYKSFTEVRI